MAATIQSLRNAIDPVVGASRDDLVVGDVVALTATDPHTTYSWVIAFAPEGSTATLANPNLQTPGTFVVDEEGPYLIQLTVDAGLPTEATQEVRLRALTAFGQLTLVAAGERRDDGGIVPVDVDVEGWANEQNFNLVTLKDFIKPMVQSGRILFVDANDGTQNYGDFDTVQGAIDSAFGNTPTQSEQWLILVRPGTYTENLTFRDWIHVIGYPGKMGADQTQDVQIDGTHTIAPSTGTLIKVSGLTLQTTSTSVSPTLAISGEGVTFLSNSQVIQENSDPAQGPAVEIAGSTATLFAYETIISHSGAGAADRVAILQSGTGSTVSLSNSQVFGPIGLEANPALVTNSMTTRLERTNVIADEIAVRYDGADFAASYCVFDGNATPFRVHPGAGILAATITVRLEFCSILGDFSYDVTGVGGVTLLDMGGVRFDSLVLPGGPVTTQTALTQSETHFYDNTVSSLLAENVQDAIDEIALASAAFAPLVYHRNLPAAPNDTVRYRGWAPVTATLVAIRVMMETVNTQGNYTLEITNEATGNTMMAATPFDMNSLVAGVPTAVGITAVPSDAAFATLDEWTITLTSDDPGFDGADIYVSLVFNTTTGSVAVAADWGTSLLLGNASVGTNPVITAGDVIEFGDSPLAAVSSAGEGRIRYNQATTSFQTSSDGGAWVSVSVSDDHQLEMNVSPGNTINSYWFAPYDCEVIGVNVYAETAPVTAGVYTLAVEDVDNSNNLLSLATFDMTSLAAATLTNVALTGTVADLLLTQGTRSRFQLLSDNGDLATSGIYVQLLYRSQ